MSLVRGWMWVVEVPGTVERVVELLEEELQMLEL